MSPRPDDHTRSDARRLAAGLVLAAVGLLVIAASFAAGRAGVSGAEVLLWTGRVMIWIPLMLIAVGPTVPDRHRLVALVAQAVTQSLVTWMYSPRAFRFPDELLHVRTALEISAHGTLAVHNTALPISPAFPGLEAVTSALVEVGHMSIFAAGTIVATVAHVTLPLAVFGFVRLLGLGGRVAAVATLIFAVGPQHPGFDTMFIYLTPALLLMVTTLVLALDVHEPRRVTGALSLVCLAGLTVTHHVTAAATLIVMALGVGVAVVTGDRDRARRLALLTVGGIVLAAAWTAWKAPEIVSYFSTTVGAAFGGAPAVRAGARPPAPVHAASPGLVGLAIAYAAFAAAAILVALGARPLWRTGRTAARLAALAALGFYGVLVVRIASGNGELAGRGFTYTLLFAAIPVAAVVIRLWPPGAPRWTAATGAAVLTLLFTGFSVVGWPPTWESVPGRFRIVGFESGVDRANTAAGQWASTHIGPGHRVACDLGTCSAMSSYGRQDALSDASPLFYAPTFGPATDRYVRDIGIDFAAVDMRLSYDVPVAGEYVFRKPIGAADATRPIPRFELVKFDLAPLISRIYDNGTIRVYDLRSEGRRAP